jgi:lipoprotein-releasing system ATP-binding protein
MSSAILAAQSVARNFMTGSSRTDVLRGIDLEVYEGEILALTGASGVGKSTLLHLLGGLDRPTSGEILYRSKALSGMSDQELAFYRNREIGFVFQFHYLLPEFSALENILIPLLIRNESRHSASAYAQQLLEQVGLAHRGHHKPGQLSGGEQQRIALARAMVTHPSIVLADEPTGNLDEETGKMVFNLIQELNKKFEVTFVIATHNMNLAKSATRRLRLTDGRLETIDQADQVTTPVQV